MIESRTSIAIFKMEVNNLHYKEIWKYYLMPYYYPYNTERESLYFPGKARNIFELKINRIEYVCAEFSRLSYIKCEVVSEFERAKKIAESAGLGEFKFYHKNNTQAISAIWEGYKLFAFRGTQSDEAGDIITDIKAWPVKWKGGGYVHLGFKSAFEDVCPELKDEIETSSENLIFTGHSLGGALAQLAVLYFEKGEVISFGSPRVGSADLWKNLNETCHRRFYHCCDICPQLPPRSSFYKHWGTPYYIHRNGNIVAGETEDTRREDRFRARLEYPLKYFNLKAVSIRELADHSMINYSSALAGSNL